MLTAVELDDQALVGAEEVDDISGRWGLGGGTCGRRAAGRGGGPRGRVRRRWSRGGARGRGLLGWSWGDCRVGGKGRVSQPSLSLSRGERGLRGLRAWRRGPLSVSPRGREVCVTRWAAYMDVGVDLPTLPLRRALWARALFQFPPEGERLKARPSLSLSQGERGLRCGCGRMPSSYGAVVVVGVGRPEGACAPGGAPLSQSLPGGERFKGPARLAARPSLSLSRGERGLRLAGGAVVGAAGADDGAGDGGATAAAGGAGLAGHEEVVAGVFAGGGGLS